jgi:hypothetical protein
MSRTLGRRVVDGAGPGESRERGRTVSDRLLGLIGGGMLLMAAVLLVTSAIGAISRAGAPSSGPLPELTLHSPVDGALVNAPLTLRFEGGAALAQMRGGWGAGEYHLHAEIDGREVMPGPRDIRPVGGGLHEWTFGRIESGEYTLRLYWSDTAHRPVSDGATAPVTIRLSD